MGVSLIRNILVIEKAVLDARLALAKRDFGEVEAALSRVNERTAVMWESRYEADGHGV